MTLATAGTMTFNVDGNTFRDADGSAVTLFKAASGVLLSGKLKTVAFNLSYTGEQQGTVANVANEIANFYVEQNDVIRSTAGLQSASPTVPGISSGLPMESFSFYRPTAAGPPWPAKHTSSHCRLARHGLFDATAVGALIDLHERRVETYDRQLFALLMFQKWHERFM